MRAAGLPRIFHEEYSRLFRAVVVAVVFLSLSCYSSRSRFSCARASGARSVDKSHSGLTRSSARGLYVFLSCARPLIASLSLSLSRVYASSISFLRALALSLSLSFARDPALSLLFPFILGLREKRKGGRRGRGNSSSVFFPSCSRAPCSVSLSPVFRRFFPCAAPWRWKQQKENKFIELSPGK